MRAPPAFLQDADPGKVLSCPRTKVGDRLGRMIVNRLKVRRGAEEGAPQVGSPQEGQVAL